MTAMTQQEKQHRTWKERASTELHDLADSTGKIVIVDFLLGMTMIIFTYSVAGLPLATLAGTLLAGIGFLRRPKNDVPKIALFVFLVIFGLLWVTFDSAVLGISTNGEILRRIIRILGVFFVAVFIADGRIDFKSLIFGITLSSLINVPAYYLGIAPDYYPGFLTGWLADKNVSGLYYATLGLLLLAVLSKRWHKILTVIIFTGILWLTGSRTSIAGFGLALVWIFTARRLNIVFKALLAIFMVRLVDFLETNFAQAGAFADRTGTDLLRSRIDHASQLKIDAAPWHGLGLGQAFVEVEDRTFFFHNSFWTLIIEGGWIYLLLIVGATIYAAFLMKQTRSTRSMYAEGATVLLMICGWRLGEVFLTMPWGLVMGLALLYCSRPKTNTIGHEFRIAPSTHTQGVNI